MHGTSNNVPEQRRRWREYVERVKAEALRRPLEVLERVAGIPPERLDGRGHPCPNPRCPDGPGRDRFSVINTQTGAVHCRRCCTSSVPGGGAADCIDAVKWMHGVSFPEAIRLIGDHFGIDPPDAPPPASVARPSGGPAAPAAANAGGARAPRDASGKPSGRRTASGIGHPSGKTFPTAEVAIAALDRRMAREGCRHVAQWPYLDAAGEHVASVVRYDRPTPPDAAKPDKTFRPVSRHPDGWRIGDPPGPWPLYTPPQPDGTPQPAAEQLAARPDDPVFVVEGEKCADAAARCGLLAVAAAHGANAAGKTDWSPLAGRDVVILADHDDAGNTGAEAYAKAAHDAGAASVRIVDAVRLQAFWKHDPQRASANDPELLQAIAAELPAGYDIADMEAECKDDDERHGLREAITEAALHTDPWTPPPPPTPPAESAPPAREPIIHTMADIEPQTIRWLWQDRIALGRLTAVVGAPGIGKSFLICDWAARVSSGRPWPDGAPCPRGDVLILSAEDDPADTLRPRLEAAGADLTRVHFLAGVTDRDADGQPRQRSLSLDDLAAIERALQKFPETRMLTIDPIGSYLGGYTDAHRENEVRDRLQPLNELARRYDVAVVLVMHRRKAGGRFADDLAMGSRAFTAIARAVYHVCGDRGDHQRRLFVPGKHNLAPTTPGLAFRIVGEPGKVARVVWDETPIDMTADEALAAEHDAPARHKRNAAAQWLQERLANGPVPVENILEEARGCGFSEKTIRRAGKALGLRRRKDGFDGGWVWSLPDAPTGDDGSDRDP
ncbi:MAG: hypothetical protein D6725_04685 [Planctomycetota bacterium]|nr:MAG: hypothetical protein D6725_04685 [Planctomycetota bacterium]